jgi:predicted DNA-binding transcriptional regulator AlpA
VDESFTIEFCAAEKISRSFFYKLEFNGRAPSTYKLGRSRRISRASYDAWRSAFEAVPA